MIAVEFECRGKGVPAIGPIMVRLFTRELGLPDVDKVKEGSCSLHDKVALREVSTVSWGINPKHTVIDAISQSLPGRRRGSAIWTFVLLRWEGPKHEQREKDHLWIMLKDDRDHG